MHIPIETITETIGYIVLGSAAVTPLFLLNIKFSKRLGLIDWPKARGLTEDQIPIIGPSLVLLSAVILLILTKVYSLSPWILTTSCVMGVMGFFDDRKPLGALDKIFFQAICAGSVLFLDPNLRASITNHYGPMGIAVYFLFIIGLVNAINFIDGVDGLAGVVLLVGAFGFIIFSHVTANLYPYTLYVTLLVGMLLPFLYLNVVHRRGFLGNVGSYFFSHLLAVLYLSLPIQASWSVSRVSFIALCFVIPIADSITVIVTRAYSLRSPFQADKGHLHHRLLQSSIPLRYILLILGLIEVAGLVTAILMYRVPEVLETWLPVAICISYIGIPGPLIVLLEIVSRHRLKQYFKRLDGGGPIYYLKYDLKKIDGTLLTATSLRRIEARVGAEIRVTDLCFSEGTNCLFVSLSGLSEPIRGISTRLDRIFQSEGVQAKLVTGSIETIKSIPGHKSVSQLTSVRHRA